MDITTLDVTQIKALIFDEIETIELAQRNIAALKQQLASRQQGRAVTVTDSPAEAGSERPPSHDPPRRKG